MKFRSGLLILLLGLFSIISVGCTTSTDVREKDSSTIVDCDIGIDVDTVANFEIVTNDEMVKVLNWIDCIKESNVVQDNYLANNEAVIIEVNKTDNPGDNILDYRYGGEPERIQKSIETNHNKNIYRRARDGFRCS